MESKLLWALLVLLALGVGWLVFRLLIACLTRD
jgi:hypothetical protein